MTRLGRCCLFTLATGALFAAAADELPPAATETVDFASQVQPLFEARCHACHGPANRMSGLRLDLKSAAMEGGHSGPAIRPGDSANSRLIHMVAGYQVKAQMPPGGPPLTALEIGLLRAWIDQGAKWPEEADSQAAAEPKSVEHWTYRPRRKPDPPDVRLADRVRNPIDRFVLARLEREGIEPSAEADRLTLLRRASLDLTGLPPSPDEIERFLADDSPNAYERLVDRLLRSERYGEKWAMHWLDQVRYADSDGYEKDDPRPWAWRYRHWVIEAVNRDLPFDRFTIEQIAGDLLPDPAVDQLVATGFHRNTLKNREGGVSVEQFRFEETVDRVHTVATVWLGATLGCAQCHDHKFDPFSQKDYYRFFAFFNNIDEKFIDAPLPGERGPWLRTHAEYRDRRREMLCAHGVPDLQADWEEKIKHHAAHPGENDSWDIHYDTLVKMTDGGERFVRLPLEERNERQADMVTDFFVRFYGQVVGGERYKELGFGDLYRGLLELRKAYPQLSEAAITAEASEPRSTHVHVRGAWDREGVEVEPGVPSFLEPIAAERPDRLDLARWIVSPENPLTARVIVNRVWAEYFGAGLATTTDDLGTQGDRPSHPDLLDWLAQDFIDSGWSLKHLHRRITTSAVYRQSSDARPDLEERDPANRLLARQGRLRLPAELIRDSALAAAGLLDDRVGGKSVYPPIPDGVTNLTFGGGFPWPTSEGPDRYRRGLYIHFQRTAPYPFLLTFDAPDRTVTDCTRERSNTPLQSLNLLNDPVFMEAAQGLAARVLTETPRGDFDDRLESAFRMCLAREPTETERRRLERYFRDQAALLAAAPGASEKWFPARLDGFDRREVAAWTGLSRVLLNLDEFVTRE